MWSVTIILINLIIGLVTYPMIVKGSDRCGTVFVLYMIMILGFTPIVGIMFWKLFAK